MHTHLFVHSAHANQYGVLQPPCSTGDTTRLFAAQRRNRLAGCVAVHVCLYSEQLQSLVTGESSHALMASMRVGVRHDVPSEPAKALRSQGVAQGVAVG